MDEKEITEKIFNLLCNQKFATWYETGNFDKWITGQPMSIGKQHLLKELQLMLFPKR